MNEEKSDVVFIVEGLRVPALKAFLSVKSKVFSAMFSGEFKESKDKEIVIEDTTYEAFKTFIRFLYCDQLVLKDKNDFELIGELYRLCDRYDFSRLFAALTDKLCETSSMKFGCFHSHFWPKMHSLLKISFEFKIEKLMNKVMVSIDLYFDNFLKEDNEVLIELNNLTDGRLFTLFAKKCSGSDNNLYRDRVADLLNLMTKKYKQLNEINESLKQVKSFNCENCGTLNQVKYDDNSTKCEECD